MNMIESHVISSVHSVKRGEINPIFAPWRFSRLAEQSCHELLAFISRQWLLSFLFLVSETVVRRQGVEQHRVSRRKTNVCYRRVTSAFLAFRKYLQLTFLFSVSVFVLGLRYEDLINENEPDMEETLKLADYEVVTGRNRRLKRALDLDFKKKLYTDYVPEVPLEETFKFELDEDLVKIRERNLEHAILDAYKK